MTNYIIEDNINFYEELNNTLTIENENNTKYCLITNEELTYTSICLPCGHSFNYLPLYNEVIKQKSNFSALEVNKLRNHQIKCPYCRTILNNILPYNEDVSNVKKINGVNVPSKYSLYPNTCEYIWKYGKFKGQMCNKSCLYSHCKQHMKKIKNISSDSEKKCICVLKYGKNKGKVCSYSVFNNSNMCKRHWNLENKN